MARDTLTDSVMHTPFKHLYERLRRHVDLEDLGAEGEGRDDVVHRHLYPNGSFKHSLYVSFIRTIIFVSLRLLIHQGDSEVFF